MAHRRLARTHIIPAYVNSSMVHACHDVTGNTCGCGAAAAAYTITVCCKQMPSQAHRRVCLLLPHPQVDRTGYNSLASLMPSATRTADMVAGAPGTWLISCAVHDHYNAGMMAQFDVV